MNQLNEIERIMHKLFALTHGDRINLENLQDVARWIQNEAPKVLDHTNDLRMELDSEYPDGNLLLNVELTLAVEEEIRGIAV